jgi:cytochrome c biogenesis protein
VDYFRAYGEFFYRIFDVLDIFDMYHSWWFQLLILFLTLNILVCSINRISATWKIVFVKNPRFNLSRFRKLSQKEIFSAPRTPDDLKKIYEPFISRRFGYSRLEQTDKGLCIFAEKWRWTRLGVYTVHLSVIFLLVGGLMGSTFGFSGYVNIPEGETVGSIRVRNTGDIKNLDFEIRCEDFNVSFYDNGAPKEFRSSLTIMEQGKPVYKKDIVVNDPLRYKGISIFQSSYGKLPSSTPPQTMPALKDLPEDIILKVISIKSGKAYRIEARIGTPVDIPEGLGKFVIAEHQKSADFGGQDIGPALIGVLTPNNGNPVDVLLPLRFPNFDKMRQGAVIISVAGQAAETFSPVKNTDIRYYTGLQITKDPGVWVVYTGFMVMIIGCFITFFMSHQRLCVEVIQSGTQSKVIVTGRANKNKLGMQSRIRKLAEKLTDLT